MHDDDLIPDWVSTPATTTAVRVVADRAPGVHASARREPPSTPAAGRHRRALPPRRGPSRAVRRRRTLVALVALALVVWGTSALLRPSPTTAGATPQADGHASSATSPGTAGQSRAPTASSTSSRTMSSSAPSSPGTAPLVASNAHPSGGTSPSATPSVAVVPRGSGRLSFFALPPIEDTAPPAAKVLKIAFLVESGAGLDGPGAADAVARTLGDPRGWQGVKRVRFRPMTASEFAAGRADIEIVLASPLTSEALCRPARTNARTSCFNDGRAIINSARWLQGVPLFRGDLTTYRFYVVNHEMGHGLGFGHATCPKAGAPAPVMLQQSLRLDGCAPNGWPRLSPRAAG